MEYVTNLLHRRPQYYICAILLNVTRYTGIDTEVTVPHSDLVYFHRQTKSYRQNIGV